MDTNLKRIISSQQSLTIDHVLFIVYQILRGLKFLHSTEIIHTDLRPDNLLINSNCDLKISGFERIHSGQPTPRKGFGHPEISYRAPECLFQSVKFTTAVDVWSVGCIMAELLGRQVFFPAHHSISLLRIITEKMGEPPESEYDFIVTESELQFIRKLPEHQPVPLARFFPQYENEIAALDLLRRLLQFHPHIRDTVDDALEHPFLSELHDPDDEPIAGFSVELSSPLEWTEEENGNLMDENEREGFQQIAWKEVLEFHPELRSSSSGDGTDEVADRK
jgi:serine/threonine protein kinase